MTQKWLSASEWENIISNKLFKEVDKIGIQELQFLKEEKKMIIRVPTSTNSKMPFDYLIWSKTSKLLHEKHQPRYVNIKIFDKFVNSIRCVEFEKKSVSKNIVPFEDFIYIFYLLQNDKFCIPDPKNRKRRLESHQTFHLKNFVLPNRTASGAKRFAESQGIEVSRKQIQNLIRGQKDAVIGKTGPRASTTLAILQEVESNYPGQITYAIDSNDILNFTFLYSFPEAINIFLSSCPEKEEVETWKKIVNELIILEKEAIRSKIKDLMEDLKDSVRFPARMHIDTTYNLGDCYVTFLMGETKNFRTKESKKFRVLPLAFMLHTDRSASNHALFADYIHAEFGKFQETWDKKCPPCIIVDGEPTLEKYGEILDVPTLRCDFHVLSLLRHKFGKKAIDEAKATIFGKMNGQKWKTGLLGAFNIDEFNQKLKKIEGKICNQIFAWLTSNKKMLIKSASAAAKLKCGLLLQYCTNNTIENFNGYLKIDIPKRIPADKLIKKLDEACTTAIRECWSSVIGASEKVLFAGNCDSVDFDIRFQYFNSFGLIRTRLLALDIPIKLAREIDMTRSQMEDQAAEHVFIVYKNEEVFILKDTNVGATAKNVQVEYSSSGLLCSVCLETLPKFICSHLIRCLQSLENNERVLEWNRISNRIVQRQRIILRAPVRSGCKASDRIGSRFSSQNHVRRVADLSEMSLLYDSSIENTEMCLGEPETVQIDSSSIENSDVGEQTSKENVTDSNLFIPLLSSTMLNESRRSGRKRKPRAAFSPSANEQSWLDFE